MMIVQCELCSTRFKLDDSKVRDEGVRVRCSKCRHIFVVRKEKPETSEEPDFDSFLDGLVAGTSQGTDLLKAYIPDDSDPTDDQVTSGINTDEQSGHETVLSPATSHLFPAETPADTETHDNSATDNVEDPLIERNVQPDSSDHFDLRSAVYPVTVSVDSSESREDSFKDDILEKALLAAANEPSHHIAGEVLSEIPRDVAVSDPSGISEPLRLPVDHDAVADVSCGTVPESLPLHHRNIPDISADELPPQAQINRKLSGSRLPLVLTVISVLAVITLAAAGLYFMNNGSKIFDKPGGESRISIRNSTGEFFINRVSGELFVVKGDAVNAGIKASGPLQLKATLYDAKGVALASRSVYCGSLLTREQLTTVPVTELESSLGSRSVSLPSNPGVQPGESIPFIALFKDVPKNATEFGVEVQGPASAGR